MFSTPPVENGCLRPALVMTSATMSARSLHDRIPWYMRWRIPCTSGAPDMVPISSPARLRPRAATELLAAGGLVTALVFLARRAATPRPTAVDRAVRRFVNRRKTPALSALLAPLDPLGYPGAYIPVAHLGARWLRRRGVAHDEALVIAAWAAWLGHRAAKLAYTRERPPRGVRIKGPKRDSFPSGHTTGATAFALTAARVLAAHGLLTRGEAIALGVGAPMVMGASRVYEDVHWATDVAGGWLLGAAVAMSLGALLDLEDAHRVPVRRRRGAQAVARRAT